VSRERRFAACGLHVRCKTGRDGLEDQRAFSDIPNRLSRDQLPFKTQCPMLNAQCSMAQCPMAQCSMLNAQCPMPNAQWPNGPMAQCPMPNAQRSMLNAQCAMAQCPMLNGPMPNAQCPMLNAQCSMLNGPMAQWPNAQCSMLNAQCSTSPSSVYQGQAPTHGRLSGSGAQMGKIRRRRSAGSLGSVNFTRRVSRWSTAESSF